MTGRALTRKSGNRWAEGVQQRPRKSTPILDSFTGASGAYSVRLLRAAYTGPLIRLRRTGDDAETDFYPDAEGVVDRTAIAIWLAGALGYGTKMYDQSGNGRDMAQATPGSQPLFVPYVAALGGMPGFLYDGVDDGFTRAQDLLATGASACTVFAVGRRDLIGAITFISIGSTATGGRVGLVGANPGIVGANYNGDSANSPSNTWNLTGGAAAARCDNVNNSVLYAGTVTSVSATALNVGSTSANIGLRVASTTSAMNGIIAEVITYRNATIDWLAFQSLQRAAFSV